MNFRCGSIDVGRAVQEFRSRNPRASSALVMKVSPEDYKTLAAPARESGVYDIATDESVEFEYDENPDPRKRLGPGEFRIKVKQLQLQQNRG